ncbi:fatty acyl-CoA reductase wat-like [Cimex lectularius]|uniref:Fatty acyl-CoA reductase n=1 Tax=Cimex lectularius TaxID=79782 RepID=A0A8I6RQ06_CIMLE|nr:fatty acyl-CoA reductase wat-like [Cimex lectularius]
MDYYEARDTFEELENRKLYFPRESEIQKFYSGKIVFITGGTGFIGSVLVEKLLRCCPNIGKIYLLLREKRNKSAEERIEKIFDNEIFSKVKKMGVDYKSKVCLITGNCELSNCGMSEEDVNILRDEVHMIFHIAACLSMDSHLKKAYTMNVRATQDLLEIAKTMSKLEVFIYVSTAYSQAPNKHIEERFYDSTYNEDHLKHIVNSFNDEEIAAISPKLVGPWENTYGFTKAIAEGVIKKYCDKLPVVVARPSIVIGCDREPLQGWINNVYGVTGVTTAACSGFINVWCSDADKVADIIPADYATNPLIVIAWDYVCNRPSNIGMFEQRIYNIVCDPRRKTTWGEYMGLAEENGVRDKIAQNVVVGEYYFGLQKNILLFYLTVIFFHIPRGLVFDTILKLSGKKPRLINGYIKVQQFNLKIIPYGLSEWTYERRNFTRMLNSMSEQDRDIFYIDMSKLCWKEYHTKTVRAIRLYLLKDPYTTLDAARKKYEKFMYARRFIFCLLGGIGFNFILPLLKTPIF